jgi:signal peptidase I
MEPTLKTGDLAVTRKAESYGVGDVVAFPVRGNIVVHRIVGSGRAEGYTIQGDNKDSPDPWHPTTDQMVGKMWLRIPDGGRFLVLLRQPLVFAGIVSGLAGIFLLNALVAEERRNGRRVKERLLYRRRRKASVSGGDVLATALGFCLLLGPALAMIVMGGLPSSAAYLKVDGGTIQAFSLPAEFSPVGASVDIKPESLQKKSQGQPVKALIELPDPYRPDQVETNRLRLCLRECPCGGEGIQPEDTQVAGRRLKATFDRGAVIELVSDVVPPDTVTFTVSGILSGKDSDHSFAGSDTVNIVG